MTYEFRHTPRPGHVAEHAAGTSREALEGWPGTERPASRTAGFTWTLPRGRVFVPFSALGIAGRSGAYSWDEVDRLHRELVVMDTAKRPSLTVLPPGTEYEPARSTSVATVLGPTAPGPDPEPATEPADGEPEHPVDDQEDTPDET